MSLSNDITNRYWNYITDGPDIALNDCSHQMSCHSPLKDALHHALGFDDKQLWNALGDAKPIFRLYRRIFALQTANPCKSEKREAFEKLYVHTDTVDWIKETIEKQKRYQYPDVMIIIGRRGCGKTTEQNRFFTIDNDWIEQQKFLWVRCDLAKIFDLWCHHGKSNDINIQQYLSMQTAYVVLKYGTGKGFNSNKNTFIAEILDGYRNQLNSQLKSSDAGERDVADRRLEQLQYVLRSIYSEGETSPVMTILDRLFSENNKGAYNAYYNWTSVGGDIIQYVKKSKKMLYAIDGADNVLWHLAQENQFYTKVLDDLIWRFRNREQNEMFILTIVNIRPPHIPINQRISKFRKRRSKG